jgi:FKBP-type peptidyl-prolyl cis-trans isomerase FkpA
MKKIFLLFTLGLVLFACRTYSDDDIHFFDSEIRKYMKKKNLNFEKSPSGMYYKVLDEGEGEYIKFTDHVSFTYKGYFMNGEVFDQQKKPVEYDVRQLIGAWKEAMVMLKPGGKMHLIAPPQLGYGDRDLDDIPPNSILIFEMEVVEVK